MKILKKILWILVGCILALGQLPAARAQDLGQPYIVQHDDTLWKLAEKYLGDGHRYPDIVAATNQKHVADPTFAVIDNPNVIQAGAVLWIPVSSAEVTVQPAPAATQAAAPAQNMAAAGESPSGKIAFSFWNNSPQRCTYEIDVIEVAPCLESTSDCQANRRIFALNNASEPALSPDGQRLAFRGWGAIPEKYNDDKIDHPYFGCPGPFADRMLGQTTLDATDYIRLGGYWEDSHPDWSPDGARLLFDTARLGDGITRIMAISADGQREETLRLAGQQPSWAPDSDRFVYRGCDLTGNRCGLWTARALPVEAWDLGLNLLTPVLTEPAAAHPDWSPVADQIAYQSPAAGSWDLYLINVDGSGQRPLTTAPGIEGLPAWSPDGQWVAYLSNQDGNWGIWIIRADGSRNTRLFAFDGGEFTPLPVPPYGSRDWLDEQISWSR